MADLFELEGLKLETAFYRRLTDYQCRQLHDASLEILERTGVRFYDERAVDILRQGGARVEDGNRVYIPAWRVEWALRAAPKQLVLYDQLGLPKLRLSGRCAYFGNGSDLLYVIDHRTNERRRAKMRDLVDAIRLLDSIPEIDFVMSFCLPDDVPTEQAELYQTRVMLEQTAKPLVYVTTDLAHTQAEVAMFEAAAGGAEALRARPFAACYINIAKPLRHNAESVQKLMWLAEKGLPAIYRPSIFTRGISTPITVAGFIALNNASQLAGIVLSQLVREGAPFIRCSHGGATFDMRTMIGQLAAPEARGFNSDLSRWYGLPTFGIGGLSGSKTVDEQAALEAALTLMAAVLSGEQLIHDVGFLDNGITGSLEQLVICQDIIGWLKRFMPGLEINAETLALDVIQEVGPDGQFLEATHTAKHCREDWQPALLDRHVHADWAAEGSQTLRQKARKRVDELLAAHKARAIAPAVRAAWAKILPE
jgi:trimethylamine--corrinoid protein Co-methyltransferase